MAKTMIKEHIEEALKIWGECKDKMLGELFKKTYETSFLYYDVKEKKFHTGHSFDKHVSPQMMNHNKKVILACVYRLTMYKKGRMLQYGRTYFEENYDDGEIREGIEKFIKEYFEEK